MVWYEKTTTDADLLLEKSQQIGVDPLNAGRTAIVSHPASGVDSTTLFRPVAFAL